MQTILITGCSSGIGLDAAATLRQRGWRVLATCRLQDDCDWLASYGFESFQLDYTSSSSIGYAFENAMSLSDGRIDALFNNGGHGQPGALEDVPRAGLRQIFETNVFGYHELTNLVIPVMRRHGRGRIVNCSSLLGIVAVRWRGAYTATKCALEGLSDTLRLELRDTNIHVCLLQPGQIETNFRLNSRAHFESWISWEESVHSKWYRTVLVPRLYTENPMPNRYELQPSAVTKKLIHALESPRPRARYRITTQSRMAAFLKWLLPTRMLDSILAKRS
ncbi:MAG: SDR family NAD(P)-dependent oxidoreductase [Rhodobacteraceae bacterium]|nr:SDR family NAD(P)-dependent oxidoreductase [Paracoccaceae bacterium]